VLTGFSGMASIFRTLAPPQYSCRPGANAMGNRHRVRRPQRRTGRHSQDREDLGMGGQRLMLQILRSCFKRPRPWSATASGTRRNSDFTDSGPVPPVPVPRSMPACGKFGPGSYPPPVGKLGLFLALRRDLLMGWDFALGNRRWQRGKLGGSLIERWKSTWPPNWSLPSSTSTWAGSQRGHTPRRPVPSCRPFRRKLCRIVAYAAPLFFTQ
jgi:hypothetical protein